jgi:hypothetical protein
MYNLSIQINEKDIRKLLGIKGQIKNNIVPKIMKAATKSCWASAQGHASRAKFEGNLKRHLTHKYYKDRGEVKVQGNAKVINEALLNEYGPEVGGFRRGTIYYSQATPKLQRWMDKKIPHARKVELGKPGTTRWGTQRNKFLEPAFLSTVNRFPVIIEKELRKLEK